MVNIVICGGHLSPALAIIEKLKKNKQYKIFYFGRKTALEGDSTLSLEYNTITNLHIPFKSIISGRLQRVLTIYTLPSLLKFPIGAIQSFIHLLTIKPKIVICFGGYLALPVSFTAYVLQIPIITHEQTHILGVSNKIISKFAKLLCLSFKDTEGIPKGVRTVFTGNPIRESILTNKNEKISDFGDKNLPLIYITGGSLGSQAINKVVAESLPRLVLRFRLLHQCGDASEGTDFEYLSSIKDNLSSNKKDNYKVIKYLDPSLVGAVLKCTSLLIGRAGANTVNEILTFGTPAILVPLPWAGQNEQEQNALMVKSIGLGEIIKQADLTADFLLSKIEKMQKNHKRYKQAAGKTKRVVQNQAANEIVKQIDYYITSKG